MQLPPGFAEIVIAIGGLCVGSFLNVCIHRLPARDSIVFPASRCPGCLHLLAWSDNIPLASYIALRGRCRYCRVPISVRYPIIEAVTCAIFVLHWYVFGATPLLAVRLVFSPSISSTRSCRTSSRFPESWSVFCAASSCLRGR